MSIGISVFDPLYIVAGSFTDFIVGLTGIGGGALMTPILLLFFGIPPVTAVATDLWFAAITKIFGALIHHRSGQVDWQVARRLWIGSLPVALVVVVLVSLDMVIAKVEWLTFAISVLVIFTSVGLIISPRLNQMARNRRIASPEVFKRAQPKLTSVAGGILGFCVALTSVGASGLLTNTYQEKRGNTDLLIAKVDAPKKIINFLKYLHRASQLALRHIQVNYWIY